MGVACCGAQWLQWLGQLNMMGLDKSHGQLQAKGVLFHQKGVWLTYVPY